MKNTIGFNLHPTKTLRYRVKNNKTLIFKSRTNYNTGITINDYPLINSDVVDKLTFLRNKGFTQYKFIGGNNSTAFNTPINKGDEVNIIINENSAYDENFEYGAIIESSVKTADEIFAPDQNGNYDISDYPDVPATTLLERIGTFPAGSNNTIRINKDTAAKYVEGFRTENLINEGYDNGTVNGSVSVIYNNGVFSFNGTATLKGDRTNIFYKKFFELPAGTYNYRIHWLSEIIPNRLDVAAQLTKEDNTAIISITNEGNKTFTLTEHTSVYIGISLLELQDYDLSFQIIISKNDVGTNFIHPIEKLDYVVAQANAKGYDVTIANNESDIKLIEKVEFSKESPLRREYIDTGIDINNFNSNSVHMKAEVQPVVNSHSMYLVQTFDNTTNGIGIYIYKAPNDIYRFYNYSGTTKRVYNPTLGSTFVLLRNIYEIKQSELYINNIKNDTSAVLYSYTVSSDTTIRLGMRDVTQLTNSTYFDGYMFNVIINDNTFIPANNGITDGMVNLKDMSFHPLISIN